MTSLCSDNTKSILLIGYQDQGNLGLGYLAAYLQTHGYPVRILDIRQGTAAILQSVQTNPPLLVGFSLIFQHYFVQFAELARSLRAGGVTCHLTIGGHYPSLCYRSVLTDIPELDCAVLFEGELTLLELVQRLDTVGDWRVTPGIAYRSANGIVCNRLRPLIEDLDSLPHPFQPAAPDATLGQAKFPFSATRGCTHRCAFCSIREFYSRVPGKKVRRRSPERVVDEIRALYDDRRARIFLFQDDDFPVAGKGGRAWSNAFIRAIKAQGLYGHILWKISCRVDEVEQALFSRMRSAGLYLVYLGIESGNRQGLKTLNKGTTVADSLRAITTLKRLGLLFGYGFMLFDPSSSFASVRANVSFLRQMLADGSAAVIYCKMLPYAGTPIAAELAREGRLIGTRHQPDYAFIDPLLNTCYDHLTHLLADWVHDRNSVSQHLNLLWHELAVIKGLLPALEGNRKYTADLRKHTHRCNAHVFDTLEATLSHYEHGSSLPYSIYDLNTQAGVVVDELLTLRDRFIHHNQERLMAVIRDAA